MHGGTKIVRYWYNHSKFNSRAIDHAFNYISAVTGIGFIRDQSAAQVWRSDDETAPETARIDLGQSDEIRAFNESYSKMGNVTDGTMLSGDPVEEIIRKLSLKARLGPLSGDSSSERTSEGPRLSRLITLLIGRLSDLGVIDRKSPGIDLWPGESRFAIAITHDVDIARRSVLGSVRLLWHKDPPGHLRGLLDSITSALGGRNPYDRISEWLRLEDDHGLKSTFFFFAGDRTDNRDPKYRISELSKSIDQIRNRGFELAVHSGIAGHSGESLSGTRSMMWDYAEGKIAGLRPHYLSAHLPEYWKAAASAGFAYTSCLGFDDDIGFFDGIDLPFVPFDIENDSAIDIVEIPIGIMDCGLIRNDSADSDEVFERGRRLIDDGEKAGGLIVLDWHQRTLYDPDYPGWGRLFWKLVEYARDKGAYFAKMHEISSLLKSGMGDMS